MKYGILFTKTSTCYGDPDIEYLDETSEKKMKLQAEKNNESIDTYIEKSKSVLQEIDYLTKEEHGKVYAAGWIRDKLLSPQVQAPEKWDNEVRKTKITEELYKTKPYRSAVGHKLVFSISKELQTKVEHAGLNLDEVMRKEAKRIMIEFQNQFHKGDKIGFAFGIHHDTKHRHMHIFLSNRTRNNKHVAMSNPLYNNTRGKYTQKDQMGFIKQRAIVSQARILRQVEKRINKLEKVKIEEIKIKPQTIEEKVIENKKKLKTAGALKFKSVTQEVLERKESYLFKKQKEILKNKDEVRELWAEYNYRKQLIDSGVNNIKNLDNIISKRFKDLKGLKQPIPSKLLREFGYLSNNQHLKFLSKAINQLQYASNNEHRQQILDKINTTKEIKKRIVTQLKLRRQEKNRFLDMIKRVKKENASKEKIFYKNLSDYRKSLDQYNLQKFLDDTSNNKIRYEYFAILKAMKKKKKNGKDITKEKDYIFHLKKFVKSQYEASSTSKEYIRSTYAYDIKSDNNLSKNTNNISLKERGRMHQSRVNSSSSLLKWKTTTDKGVKYD